MKHLRRTPGENADALSAQSAFGWGKEQPILAAPDETVEAARSAGAPVGADARTEAGEQAQARAWQARPGGPVVAEDDEWSEGRRVPPAEVARLLRRLSARDRMVLGLLNEHSYLTTEQIQALLFGSLRRAESRLRKLRAGTPDGLGLLTRWSRTPAGSWAKMSAAWLLRQKGALVLAALRGADSAGTSVLVTRSSNAAWYALRLEHDLGAAGFFTGLVRASRDRPDQGLYTWLGEAATRRKYQNLAGQKLADDKHGAPAPAPDGYGRYLLADREVVFQLEWDRDTEPVSTITKKAEGYRHFYAGKAGGASNHILWVASNERRERGIRGALEGTKPDSRRLTYWTTTEAQLSELGHLGAAWSALPSSGRRVSLLEWEGRTRSDKAVEDCLGKTGWWDRRSLTETED